MATFTGALTLNGQTALTADVTPTFNVATTFGGFAWTAPRTFTNNSGTIGAGASNSDSKVGAMDHITDFQHGAAGQDIIEVNGFGFTAAQTANVTAVTLAGTTAFTSANVAGYFADGNVVHSEKQQSSLSEQIYIDVNKSGSFEAASDIVIHLDNFTKGLTPLDFQFH